MKRNFKPSPEGISDETEMKRNFKPSSEGISDLLFVIVVLIGLAMCVITIDEAINRQYGRTEITTTVTAKEAATNYEGNSFTITITPWSGDDASYIVYGELVSLQRLVSGVHGVAAFRPLSEGGSDYESFGWRTCYVPNDVLDTIGGETLIHSNGTEAWITRDRVFKIEMTNCEDGGGFIDLPEIILGVEEISKEDIPVWGGR